ncbi:MAG: hypothetical protein AAF960_29875 [Bacteroidota bacterium]
MKKINYLLLVCMLLGCLNKDNSNEHEVTYLDYRMQFKFEDGKTTPYLSYFVQLEGWEGFDETLDKLHSTIKTIKKEQKIDKVISPENDHRNATQLGLALIVNSLENAQLEKREDIDLTAYFRAFNGLRLSNQEIAIQLDEHVNDVIEYNFIAVNLVNPILTLQQENFEISSFLENGTNQYVFNYSDELGNTVTE